MTGMKIKVSKVCNQEYRLPSFYSFVDYYKSIVLVDFDD